MIDYYFIFDSILIWIKDVKVLKHSRVSKYSSIGAFGVIEIITSY